MEIKLIFMALKLVFLEKKILENQQFLGRVLETSGRLSDQLAVKVAGRMEKQIYKFERLEIEFDLFRKKILHKNEFCIIQVT